MTFFTVAITIGAIVLNCAILYAVIKAAIVNAMRRVRREEWTETHDAENADWLSAAERAALASRAPQRGENPA